MASRQLGDLPPRYLFLINPYSDVRLSKCPRCEKLTHMRKFPLFIHIEGYGPLVLGKTCRYCSRCELIMAHKNELDAEVQNAMLRLASEASGTEYTVLGTMNRKVWQRSIQSGQPLNEGLKHVAQFKNHLILEVDPGGWRPVNEGDAQSKAKNKKK